MLGRSPTFPLVSVWLRLPSSLHTFKAVGSSRSPTSDRATADPSDAVQKSGVGGRVVVVVVRGWWGKAPAFDHKSGGEPGAGSVELP